MLIYYPVENPELLKTYRQKLQDYPFLNSVRKVAARAKISEQKEALDEMVATMKRVKLPGDFWDEFLSVNDNLNEITKNHELLERIL